MLKKSLAIGYSASPFLAFEWHHGHPVASLGGGYWFWSITWRSPWQVKGCQVHTDAASGAHKKQKKTCISAEIPVYIIIFQVSFVMKSYPFDGFSCHYFCCCYILFPLYMFDELHSSIRHRYVYIMQVCCLSHVVPIRGWCLKLAVRLDGPSLDHLTSSNSPGTFQLPSGYD